MGCLHEMLPGLSGGGCAAHTNGQGRRGAVVSCWHLGWWPKVPEGDFVCAHVCAAVCVRASAPCQVLSPDENCSGITATVPSAKSRGHGRLNQGSRGGSGCRRAYPAGR